MEARFQFYKKRQIRYYLHGKGKPLVLLHGYQADSGIWKPLISHLEKDFQLIIPDLPGHGESQLIRSTNSMEFLADSVFAICISLGLREVDVVGHSMGGYVALSFAEKYRSITDSVFVLNAHPFEDNLNKLLARNREADLIQQGKKELLLNNFIVYNFSEYSIQKYPERAQLATQNALRQNTAGMLADLSGMMLRTNKMYLLSKKRPNIYFLLGQEDKKIPANIFDGHDVPEEKVIILENCGHYAILEQPERVAKIISEKQ